MSVPRAIPLEQHDEDDPAFIDIVRSAVLGTTRLTRPSILHIIHIEDWFDYKWLGFSGKVLGALGIRKDKLTVPPFHPHRVLSERVFEMADNGSGKRLDNAPPLHESRTSETNTRACLNGIYDAAAIAWYSGRSAVTDRAALMIYTLTSDEPSMWYAGFEKRDVWSDTHRAGISAQQLADLLAHGKDVV